jgi:hypothetical protein
VRTRPQACQRFQDRRIDDELREHPVAVDERTIHQDHAAGMLQELLVDAQGRLARMDVGVILDLSLERRHCAAWFDHGLVEVILAGHELDQLPGLIGMRAALEHHKTTA